MAKTSLYTLPVQEYSKNVMKIIKTDTKTENIIYDGEGIIGKFSSFMPNRVQINNMLCALFVDGARK